MTMMLWMALLYFAILPALSISITVILYGIFQMGKVNRSLSKKTLISAILVFVISLAVSPPVIFKTVMENEGLTYVETGKTAYFIEASYAGEDLYNRIEFEGITYEDFYSKLMDAPMIFEPQIVDKTSESFGKPIANLVETTTSLDAPNPLEKIVSRIYGMQTNFDLIYSSSNKNLKHCVFSSEFWGTYLYCDQRYTEKLIAYYLDEKNYDYYISYYDGSKTEKVKLESPSNQLIWNTTLKTETINFNNSEKVREAFPDAVVRTLNPSGGSIFIDILSVSKDGVIGKPLADVYVEGTQAYQVLGFYREGPEDYSTSRVYVRQLPDDISERILDLL